MLPHKGGVGVVGLVGALLGTEEAALNHLHYHHFKGLAVTLIHGKQKARQHDKHHEQGRRTGGEIVTGEKV